MDEERPLNGAGPGSRLWLPEGMPRRFPGKSASSWPVERGAHCYHQSTENGGDPRRPTERAEAGQGPGEAHDASCPPRQGSSVILEQARCQAHFEAARIRDQAKVEAERSARKMQGEAQEHARQEANRLVDEAIAEAARMKEVLVDESREQAFYEGTQLREQATAQARQIIVEAEQAAEVLAAEAHREADRIREQGISESERVKAAIIAHARETAESERARLLEEAAIDADEIKATLTELARHEADRIRTEAEQEKEAILDKAQDEAVRLHLEAAAVTGVAPGDEPQGALLRASDVGSREFPMARRGFDPESVRTWLKVVQTSYSILEEERHQARREFQRALEILEAARIFLGSAEAWGGHSLQAALDQQLQPVRAAWQRSVEALTRTAPYGTEYDLPSLLVRASQLEGRLGKRLFGYSSWQVHRLLEELTTELARLNNQLGALRAENEELRARLLAQVSTPVPSHLAVLGFQPADAIVASSAFGTRRRSNGSAPTREELAG